MSGFTKLFGSITRSTIWGEDDATVKIWITMLAICDRDGIVEASVPGLAHEARKSIAEVEIALAKFMAPDPHSRTKEHEGRRIEEVRGGWRLLNHDYYRGLNDAEDRREKAAERQRRSRERRNVPAQQTLDVTSERDASVTERDCHDSSQESREVRHADQIRSDADQISQREAAAAARLREPRGPRGWNTDQLAAAERVWAFLNRARKHVMPKTRELAASKSSLDMICKLFAGGHSEEDVKEVIRQYGRETKRDPAQGKWFDGVTPFRPDNFTRTLGKIGTDGVARTNGSNGAGAPVQQGPRTITINGVKHRL